MTYQPKDVELSNLSQLAPGQYLVQVKKVAFTDDRSTISGEPSGTYNDERDWDDPNPALYVYMVCATGIMHHRFYWNGYLKFDELSKLKDYRDRIVEFRAPRSSNVRQYAINKETGCRVIDTRKSDYARNQLDQFCKAAGITGKDLNDLQDKQLWIEIIHENKFGKKFNKILQVSPADKPFTSGPRSTPQETLVTFALPRGIDPTKPVF